MARMKQTPDEPIGAATSTRLRKRAHNTLEDDSNHEDITGQPHRGLKRDRSRAASRGNGRASHDAHDSVYDFPVEDDTAEYAASSPTVKSPAKNDVMTPSRKQRTMATVAGTPSQRKDALVGETPKWRRNDRSARKKSARALIESVVTGGNSDDEDEQDIAREIYESSDEEEGDAEGPRDDDMPQEISFPGATDATPTKRPRGRPRKGTESKARKKSPTPPRDLPPHELYFAQNRPGASKTSANSLNSLQLLTHDEYFPIAQDWKDSHAEDIEFLLGWHAKSFPQWNFELSQGFSVCLYGYGSKRPLLQQFAQKVYDTTADHARNKIVIINGYVRSTSARDILGAVGGAIDSSYKLPAGNPSALLSSIKLMLSSHNISMTLIINSMDAIPLRRPILQVVLAQLASHPQIQLICSVDSPDFSLLWDSGLRSALNFVFHDCTTFAPFSTEIDVVDDVHELLGRKSRHAGGKEGVTYVLRSLPENAKNLFRLLIGEVLVAMEEEGIAGGENPGIEYRILYTKAVEEFICSSEVAFRTLLKEFYDHQMIVSRKDILGTELLSVPFRKEELEAILEDLMS